MKPKILTVGEYMKIINRLVKKGWMPCGAFGEMLFCRDGRKYDLSAADLNQLPRIEREGLFLA